VLTRQTGIVIIVVGIAAALLAALANPIGLGDPGFHWRQQTLLGVGIVVAIVGAVITWRASKSEAQPNSDAPRVQDPDR
jgi:threonine/homoserine efflux transporter RhtA